MEELIIIALLLFSSRRGAAPTGPGGGPTRPGGPTGPRPPNPGTPGSEPSDSGRIFGAGSMPAGWDPAGNKIYVSPQCDLVLEGAGFEPRSWGSFSIGAIEESTLTDALAIASNSVYGYVDWLLANTSLSTPEQIARQVLVQANALCADVPRSQWPAALEQWFTSFVGRITPWIDEGQIGLDEG